MVPEVQNLTGFSFPNTGIAGDNLLSKKEMMLRENRKLLAFSSLPLVWVGRGALCTGAMNLQFCFLPPRNSYQTCDEIRAEAEMHFFRGRRIQTQRFFCLLWGFFMGLRKLDCKRGSVMVGRAMQWWLEVITMLLILVTSP